MTRADLVAASADALAVAMSARLGARLVMGDKIMTTDTARTLPLSYVHACELTGYVGSGIRHTKGNGKARRKTCAYCSGAIRTDSGYWTVQEWRGDGRYSMGSAVKILPSESRAEDWRLDHRLGANPELAVRWIATAEPLAVTGADCPMCRARVMHRIDECAKYATAGAEQVISDTPTAARTDVPAVTAERPADASDDAAGQYSDHHTARGTWCRWSMCHVSGRLAARDDQRCPADCPDSAIELFADPEVPAIGRTHCGYAILAAVPTGRDEWVVAAYRADTASHYAVWRVGRQADGSLIYSAGDYDQRTEYDAVRRMISRAGYEDAA